jgi:hypothetical protein
MNRSQFRQLVREVIVEVINRREFLKRAAIGGMGVAAGYGLGKLNIGGNTETLPVLYGKQTYDITLPSGKVYITQGPIYHRGGRYIFDAWGYPDNKITVSDDGVTIAKSSEQ